MQVGNPEYPLQYSRPGNGADEVLDAIIKAITMIENAPQQHLTDYSIYDALCKARDYMMQE